MVALSQAAWNALAAIGLTLLASVLFQARHRMRGFKRCWMCKRNHEPRPQYMSAIEFWRAYCNRGQEVA